MPPASLSAFAAIMPGPMTEKKNNNFSQKCCNLLPIVNEYVNTFVYLIILATKLSLRGARATKQSSNRESVTVPWIASPAKARNDRWRPNYTKLFYIKNYAFGTKCRIISSTVTTPSSFRLLSRTAIDSKLYFVIVAAISITFCSAFTTGVRRDLFIIDLIVCFGSAIIKRRKDATPK